MPFSYSTEAGIKAEISSQNLVYGWPRDFMEAFVPETRLSPFFNWRNLMSCTAECGLLITGAGLNGSMDQNWLYTGMPSTFAIPLHWSLGHFACEDHTGSHFFDVCKCGKRAEAFTGAAWLQVKNAAASGRAIARQLEPACSVFLFIGRAQLMLFRQGVDFVSVLQKNSFKCSYHTSFAAGANFKLCPFVPYHHPFLFCSLHPL